MSNHNAERVQREIAARRPKTARSQPFLQRNRLMIGIAVGLIAGLVITGFLGFGGVKDYSWDGARILFYILSIITVSLTALAFVAGSFERRSFWDR